MLFDNQCQTQGIINSRPRSLNVLGIWWLSLWVHVLCSSTSMHCSRLSVVVHLPLFLSYFTAKISNKTLNRGDEAAPLLEIAKKKNQRSQKEFKVSKKLWEIMIIFVSAVRLISADAEDGRGRVFLVKAPMRSRWSSVTQPASPQPEHLDQTSNLGDVSSQPGFKNDCLWLPLKPKYLPSVRSGTVLQNRYVLVK